MVELPQDPAVDNEMDGYSIYLPISHASGEESYPVLVFLQGAFGVGGPIDNVNHWGLSRLLRDETSLETERNRLLLDTFIVVCPHIEEGNYHDHPEVVRSILDTVIDEHGGDPRRIYLTGLSRGGHGSWGLADRLPGTFAAIAPIGAHSTGVRDWARLRDTAVWISHNRADPIVSFEQSERAIEQLEAVAGAEVRRYPSMDVRGTDFLEQRYLLTSMPVDSHDAWTEVYSRPEFYRWLLEQRRELPAPRDR